MNFITLLQMVFQQTWQVALQAGLVWFLTRTIGSERPPTEVRELACLPHKHTRTSSSPGPFSNRGGEGEKRKRSRLF